MVARLEFELLVLEAELGVVAGELRADGAIDAVEIEFVPAGIDGSFGEVETLGTGGVASGGGSFALAGETSGPGGVDLDPHASEPGAETLGLSAADI